VTIMKICKTGGYRAVLDRVSFVRLLGSGFFCQVARIGSGTMRDRLGETLSANKPEGIFFFFSNNDICFFLVESRGQVFIYNRGKKNGRKSQIWSHYQRKEREKSLPLAWMTPESGVDEEAESVYASTHLLFRVVRRNCQTFIGPCLTFKKKKPFIGPCQTFIHCQVGESDDKSNKKYHSLVFGRLNEMTRTKF
jgi:hypothetical protein